MAARVICGDALEVLRDLPDASVSLIATDPPYYRIKNEPWDRQWNNPEAFLAWMGELCAEWRRVLKPNGSLYVFASPKMARRVGNVIAEHFNILTDIRWQKDAGWHQKAAKTKLRAYFPASETIWFAEPYADVFKPLREYLVGERDRAGWTNRDVDHLLGTNGMARHYFSSSQWEMPTPEKYAAIQAAAPLGCFQREYEDLRREYEDLRRPFHVTADVPYTDVWTFPAVQSYPGKHPCEKPLAMMEHIIRVSSRPGDVVLDCFAGSGVTGEAAIRNGREVILIEKSEYWARKSEERCAAAQQTLFPLEDA